MFYSTSTDFISLTCVAGVFSSNYKKIASRYYIYLKQQVLFHFKKIYSVVSYSSYSTLQTIFHLYIPKKIQQILSSNINEMFPKQNHNVLILLYYDILEGSTELDVAVHLSAQGTTYSISKRNYEISVVQEIHIQIRISKMVP